MSSRCNQKSIHHPLKGKISSFDLDELEAILILSTMESLGSAKIRTLLATFGTGVQALHANPIEIASLPGLGPKISLRWEEWQTSTVWRREMVVAYEQGVKMTAFGTPGYPKKLLDLPDPPMILYYKGNLSALNAPCIAIVGTRQSSIYGNEMAHAFASDLAAFGFIIVSGLARGVDTAAHIGAIKSGKTAAIIGSGLANIYPAENHQLSNQIAENGCLLSEFSMFTPPDRQNFPQRNRIVAALSNGIVLIEAPNKSGAMITMQSGIALRKKLFALPGRVDNKNFCGNHALIKAGKACLVENAADIANEFEDLFGRQPIQTFPAKPRIELDIEESEFLQLLPIEEISIEEIVQITKRPISALNVLLMKLVLKRALKEFPGKVYKKQVTNV